MGAWIALVLFGIVVVLVCFGLIAKIGFGNSSSNSSLKKGSVVVLNLSGQIVEKEQGGELDYMGLIMGDVNSESISLVSLKEAIKAAKDNDYVSGMYIKCNGVSASPATLNALRNCLLDFKQSGKPIITYSDTYSMGEYYISTVADFVFLNPAGKITLKGIGGQVLYYKDLLDKIGVNMQVVKVGTYKSAVEPYIMLEMSEPARAQLDTLYGEMWSIINESISNSRKITQRNYIDSLINNEFLALREGDFDRKAKLVDGLYYERCMDSIVASKVGVDKKKLNYVDIGDLYDGEFLQSAFSGKNQIAVLFACGEIMDGGGSSVIDYYNFVPIITSLADDDNIKGMVLRVNSPGGSAFGSEQIGEALEYFKSKGKPLAVSMGDYAASGGYWISSGADRIFANELTITGSIGIFGLIPDLSPLIKKIGVNPQLVSTNPEASFPSIMKPLNERQYEAMQEMIEKGYDKFVKRVATGRHMSEKKVREIGEGRVWSARKALEIGLVDEIGDLQDAVNWVAEKISVSNYSTPYYPLIENSIWSYLNQMGGASIENKMKEILGTEYTRELALQILILLNQYPVQAKMPVMDIRFDDNFIFPYKF